MPFNAEDFARSYLVHVLPRSRYRLAAQNDARFTSFANNSMRIAYRQQGATPAFLLFSGEGQNPQAAAMAAAAWAETNWRPNAIQRRVSPGVVVVHVAPGNQLTPAGPVAGAVVPAAVWTVDSASGKVDAVGNPPGSPSGSTLRQTANDLMRGVPAPTLGQLDLAERGVMQLRTSSSMPRAFGGLLGLALLYLGFRYGLAGLAGLLVLPEVLGGNITGDRLALAASFGISVLMLAGILLGLALVFNFRNAAMRVPLFSSSTSTTRNLAWGGYVAVMVALVVAQQAILPGLQHRNLVTASQGNYTHVSLSAADDGSETFVYTAGDLTVDLSQWPSNEWSGVTFKTSNPSVLSLDTIPGPDAPPIAKYSAHQSGAARVDASSADGKYTFQVRVDVGPPPS